MSVSAPKKSQSWALLSIIIVQSALFDQLIRILIILVSADWLRGTLEYNIDGNTYVIIIFLKINTRWSVLARLENEQRQSSSSLACSYTRAQR